MIKKIQDRFRLKNVPAYKVKKDNFGEADKESHLKEIFMHTSMTLFLELVT